MKTMDLFKFVFIWLLTTAVTKDLICDSVNYSLFFTISRVFFPVIANLKSPGTCSEPEPEP
jgi:hypothetical protein